MARFRTEYIIILLLVAALMVMGNCYRVSEAERSASSAALSGLTDTLTTVRDKFGREIASKDAVIITSEKSIEELKGINEDMDGLIETIEQLKGKVNWAARVRTTTTVTAEGETTTIYRDTVLATVIDYADEWMVVHAETTTDSFNIEVMVKNQFDITQSTVEPWFRSNYSEVRVKNENPNTVTTGLSSLHVKHIPKKLNLGAYAGLGVRQDDGIVRIVPQIGLGLQYNLIPIK